MQTSAHLAVETIHLSAWDYADFAASSFESVEPDDMDAAMLDEIAAYNANDRDGITPERIEAFDRSHRKATAKVMSTIRRDYRDDLEARGVDIVDDLHARDLCLTSREADRRLKLAGYHQPTSTDSSNITRRRKQRDSRITRSLKADRIVKRSEVVETAPVASEPITIAAVKAAWANGVVLPSVPVAVQNPQPAFNGEEWARGYVAHWLPFLKPKAAAKLLASLEWQLSLLKSAANVETWQHRARLAFDAKLKI